MLRGTARARSLSALVVVALAVSGAGPVSSSAAAQGDLPAAPPLSVEGTTISWTAPSSAEPITGYRLQVDCGFEGDGTVLGPDERSATLFSSGPCIVRLAALTAEGAGATARVVVNGNATLAAPRVTVMTRTSTSITLSVQAPRVASTPVDRWGIDVFDEIAAAGLDYYSPGAATTWDIEAVGDDEALITFGGLDASRTYSLGVMAGSSVGWLSSPWTFVSSVTTLSDVAAATPVLEISGSGASIVLDGRGLAPDSPFTARFSIPNTDGETADVTGTVGPSGRVWARIPVPSAVPDGMFGYVSVEAPIAGEQSVFEWSSFSVDKAAFFAAPTPIVSTPAQSGVGSVHTVELGLWDPQPSTLSYQWLRDGSPIDGATTASYALQAADQSTALSVRVTGLRDGFDGTDRTSATVAIGEFPAEPGPVSGRAVSAANAEPLADMTVRLHDPLDYWWSTPVATTSTGVDGSFVFESVEPGLYLVEIEDPGSTFASVWSGGEYWRDLAETVVVGYGAASTGDLALPLAASISGAVAVEGQARPGHQMRIERAEDGVQVENTLLMPSDDGSFVLSPLPPGSYRVAAQSVMPYGDPEAPAFTGEWWQQSPTRAGAELIAVVAGQAVTGIDFDLQSAPRLSGTVRDVRGNPIEGVYVQVLDPAGTDFSGAELGANRSAYTDSEGHWVVAGAPVGQAIIQFTPFDPNGFSGPGLPFQRVWHDGAAGPTSSTPIAVAPGQVIDTLDVVLPDRVAGVTPAAAPSTSYDAATRVLTWSEPASELPIVGYVFTMGGLREGDGGELTTLDDRRLEVYIFDDRPTLVVLRPLTANGPGAPAIVAINPEGSAPAPTVQVSNLTTTSFDVTATAPNGWSGGVWGITVYETDGVDQIEVVGYDDGPAPTSLTRTVSGLKPDTAYRIVAAVDNGEAGSPLSSWSVTSTRTLDPAATTPFASAPNPVILGPSTVGVGTQWSAGLGAWNPAPTAVTYQWLRDGAAVSGATESFYTLSRADSLTDITVRVTATRAGYTPTVRTSSPVSVPDLNSVPFVDVPPDTQFASEIAWLADRGVTRGYVDGTFRPLGTVNRDAMAAFLYRFAGSPAFTPPVTPSFIDVPTSNQFYKEIEWLRSTGITTGYPDGTFRPLGTVARDAMAAFLFRFSEFIADEDSSYVAPDTSPFIDVPTSNQFYREVAWLAEQGISTGYTDGTFRTLASVNRDAMAAFLFRFSGLLLDEAV